MFEFISSFLCETEWTKTIQEEDFFILYFLYIFDQVWKKIKCVELR